MSVKSKMTAIADKIRALLGISGTMGLDAMATNLTTEQTNVTNAFTVIGNKGGTVPGSRVSGNLVSAIDSIPAGVTVQKKTGTFTTDSNGWAAVDVGFKPDVIAFNGGRDVTGVLNYCGSMFTEANQERISTIIAPREPANYVFTQVLTTRTTTGAEMELFKVAPSFAASPEANRTVSYTAIKYT